MDDFELDDRTDAAMRRLRAVDPAAGIETTGAASPMPDLVRQQHRRRVSLLAAASVVLLVSAVAVGVTEVRGSDPTPQALGSSSMPNTTAPTTGASTTDEPASDPKAQTEALLSRLLGVVPDPPNSTPSETAPNASVEKFGTTTGSSYELHERRWLTAPGTIDDALDFFRTHRPDELTGVGSMSSTHAGPGTSVEGLIWGGTGTPYAEGVEVQIAIAAFGGGVAVGVTAQATWFPARDPATLLGDVSSVDVTIVRAAQSGAGPAAGAPTVRRTLTGDAAQTLAELVDGLTVDVNWDLPRHCLLSAGEFSDTFDFTTASGATARVVETTTGCWSTMLTPAGGTAVHLIGTDLNAPALRILGLPKDYGYTTR